MGIEDRNDQTPARQGGFRRTFFGPGLRFSVFRQLLFPGGFRGLPTTLWAAVRYARSAHLPPAEDAVNVEALRVSAWLWGLLAMMGWAVALSALWYGRIYWIPGAATAVPGTAATVVTVRRLLRAGQARHLNGGDSRNAP